LLILLKQVLTESELSWFKSVTVMLAEMSAQTKTAHVPNLKPKLKLKNAQKLKAKLKLESISKTEIETMTKVKTGVPLTPC